MTPLTQDILNTYNFEEVKIDRDDKDFVERFIKTQNGFVLSYHLEIEQEEDLEPTLTDKNNWIELDTKEELDSFLSKTKEEVLDWIESEHWDFIKEDYIIE